MTVELVYTSAPTGLRPGSSGYCTVQSSRGLPAPTVDLLESLSGYRHLFPPGTPQAAGNPVNYGHYLLRISGRREHVLSRVSDYELDHTGRSNKLAHHQIIADYSAVQGGPAWLLKQPGWMMDRWDGKVAILDQARTPPNGARPPARCIAWARATNDSGWAGVLAEAFLANPERKAFIIYAPGTDLLSLFEEAISLLPVNRRWEVTFSTYGVALPNTVDVLWNGVIAGSQEVLLSQRHVGALRIDLTAPLPQAAGGDLVDLARSGVMKKAKQNPVQTAPVVPPSNPSPLASSGIDLTSADDPIPLVRVSPQTAPPPVPRRKTSSKRPLRKWPILLAATLLLAAGLGWVAYTNWPKTSDLTANATEPSKPTTEQPTPQSPPAATQTETSPTTPELQESPDSSTTMPALANTLAPTLESTPPNEVVKTAPTASGAAHQPAPDSDNTDAGPTESRVATLNPKVRHPLPTFNNKEPSIELPGSGQVHNAMFLSPLSGTPDMFTITPKHSVDTFEFTIKTNGIPYYTVSIDATHDPPTTCLVAENKVFGHSVENLLSWSLLSVVRSDKQHFIAFREITTIQPPEPSTRDNPSRKVFECSLAHAGLGKELSHLEVTLVDGFVINWSGASYKFTQETDDRFAPPEGTPLGKIQFRKNGSAIEFDMDTASLEGTLSSLKKQMQALFDEANRMTDTSDVLKEAIKHNAIPAAGHGTTYGSLSAFLESDPGLGTKYTDVQEHLGKVSSYVADLKDTETIEKKYRENLKQEYREKSKSNVTDDEIKQINEKISQFHNDHATYISKCEAYVEGVKRFSSSLKDINSMTLTKATIAYQVYDSQTNEPFWVILATIGEQERQ